MDLGYHQAAVVGQLPWFYLYLIEDIFSRKITGYEVYEEESGSQAALLMKRRVLREGCWCCTRTTVPR